MRLTVSVSYAQRAEEAISDSSYLSLLLRQTRTNVWTSTDYYGEDDSEEITDFLSLAGVPKEEITIEQ